MSKLSQDLKKVVPGGMTDEAARLILSSLVDNLKTASTHMSRRFFIIILCAVAFELLTRSAVQSITLFGVDLKELGLIKRLIPLLCAYLYFSSLAWFALWGLLQSAHDAIVKSLYPQLAGAHVETYMFPVMEAMLFGAIHLESRGSVRRPISVSSAPFLTLLFAGPPAFIVYAYITLFSSYGLNDGMTLISAAVSLFLIVQGGLLLLGAVSAEDE